jgi:hypothetical protein
MEAERIPCDKPKSFRVEHYLVEWFLSGVPYNAQNTNSSIRQQEIPCSRLRIASLELNPDSVVAAGLCALGH